MDDVPHYLDNLDVYLEVIRSEVAQLADRTLTPPHWWAGNHPVPDELVVGNTAHQKLVEAEERWAKIWREVFTAWVDESRP